MNDKKKTAGRLRLLDGAHDESDAMLEVFSEGAAAALDVIAEAKVRPSVAVIGVAATLVSLAAKMRVERDGESLAQAHAKVRGVLWHYLDAKLEGAQRSAQEGSDG